MSRTRLHVSQTLLNGRALESIVMECERRPDHEQNVEHWVYEDVLQATFSSAVEAKPTETMWPIRLLSLTTGLGILSYVNRQDQRIWK